MHKYGVVNYLLSAVENNYIDSININKVSTNNIHIEAKVSNEQKIQPVLWMIEANMYTKRELSAKNVNCNDNSIVIQLFDDTTYEICIKTK